MTGRRSTAVVLAGLSCVFGAMLVSGSPALAEPAPAAPGDVGRSVAPPAAPDCPARSVPPPPVDTSETPRPGELAPAPLPVPTRAVGGDRMAECGHVLAPGAPPPPADTAPSWVLADLNSGAVLAARAPHARERPASTLKVLTALVVLRRLELDATVDGTTDDANITGSRVGVGAGGRYTVRQLLTGLLLNSGNDAANALARQLGGVPATLDAMAATAGELGALDTRPASPSGLDAPGMSTSAYDLAALYRVAMRKPEFVEISRTRLSNFPGHGDRPGFRISNDNRLLAAYPGSIGGKTGFTDDARHTLIGAADRGGRRLVVVLLRGEQRPVPMHVQAARLLDYGFTLPPATPPVGTLVDRRPADQPPVPAPADDAGAASYQAGNAPAPSENRLAGLLVVGGGALLGILLSVLITRRTPRQH